MQYCKMLNKIMKPINNCVRHYTNAIFNTHYLRNLPITQCSELSNGLTIATEERQTSNVCMGLYINCGSRYETEDSNGITHFIEHMAFKGTKKRDKIVLLNEMSKTGAKFKCYTTREIAVYYVECLTHDFLHVADILFDCIFNNAFCCDEVDIQRSIIYQEMLEHDMSTVNILYDYLHSTAFQGTPLAQTVMGPSKNLKNFKPANLSNHVSKMFTPQRTVLAAVGDVKHELLIRLGEQYLSKLKRDHECIHLGAKRYTGSEIVYRDDSIPVAHVAIAVEGPSFSDENRIGMDLVSSVIGAWDASQPCGRNHGTRLAYFASAGGLCDAYKAFNFYYQDTGLCGVEFISPRKEVDNMIIAIQGEWMRLCHVIIDADIVTAKNELISKMLNKFETATGTCNDIGQYILKTGCRPAIYEQIEAVDKITADHVKSICKKYFYDKCPVVAGVGSTECLFPYTNTRSNMYWLRV